MANLQLAIYDLKYNFDCVDLTYFIIFSFCELKFSKFLKQNILFEIKTIKNFNFRRI